MMISEHNNIGQWVDLIDERSPFGLDEMASISNGGIGKAAKNGHSFASKTLDDESLVVHDRSAQGDNKFNRGQNRFVNDSAPQRAYATDPDASTTSNLFNSTIGKKHPNPNADASERFDLCVRSGENVGRVVPKIFKPPKTQPRKEGFRKSIRSPDQDE
jgi:hypothetical protein